MQKLCILLIMFGLAGCTPALNWREARTEDGNLVAMFPCRPDRHERVVSLRETTASMRLLVCAAEGTTFALGWLEVAGPGTVTATLETLRAAMVGNLGGTQVHVAPWALSGMTANALAARLSVQGRMPDGKAVVQEAAFFARGSRVYQASVISPRIDRDAAEMFFSGLKLAP